MSSVSQQAVSHKVMLCATRQVSRHWQIFAIGMIVFLNGNRERNPSTDSVKHSLC